jgi:hypothetical protein
MYVKKEIPVLVSIRVLIFLVIIGSFLSGCDTLEPDTIEDQTNVEIKSDPIVLTPQSSGIINLKALINSTSGNHTFRISSQPKLGKLESLGNDLLQYVPNEGVTKGRDGFKLSIFGNNNIIIDEDSVTIIITPDSTAYPCGVWAFEDYVYNVDSAVVIDVLANDAACGIDVSQLEVSIPEIIINGKSVPASYGAVDVLSDGKLRYTPGANYNGGDLFYYQITKPKNIPNHGDPEETSIAMVYIIGPINCDSLEVRNDFFILQLDSIQTDTLQFDTVTLAVVANDNWCTRQFPQMEIIDFPDGSATPTWGNMGVLYTPPPNATVGYIDRFRYRLCVNHQCKEADVTIKFQ